MMLSHIRALRSRPLPQLIHELEQVPQSSEPKEKFTEIKHHPILRIEYLNELAAEGRFRKAYLEELGDLLAHYKSCTRQISTDKREPMEMKNEQLDWHEINPVQIQELEGRISTTIELRNILEKTIAKRVKKEEEIAACLLEDLRRCEEGIAGHNEGIERLRKRIHEIEGIMPPNGGR